MSTKNHNQILDSALANIPTVFRLRLTQSYLDIKKNCAESRYETAGFSVGKLCETALRCLQQKIHGTYTAFGKKIDNLPDECRKLITSPESAGNESERIVIPRALVFLYTMRNKRGIGHVGGDVDANAVDLAVMAKISDWVICEFIRINHAMSLEDAQALVEKMSAREFPVVWEVAGKKRVLKDGLTARDEALLLLYTSRDISILVEDLCDWVEYSNPPMFKNKILHKLHKERLLEFDKDSDSISISPKGVQYVESHPKWLTNIEQKTK